MYKEYKKLNKYDSYDQKAAEELAEAMTEQRELQNRIDYLQELIDENEELHGFIWGTADGKYLAVHKIEDDHLKNIMTHCLGFGRHIPKAVIAEARKRGFDIPVAAKQLGGLLGRLIEAQVEPEAEDIF